jgi:hypothetical protein
MAWARWLFPAPGWAHEQPVLATADKGGSRQIEDQGAVHLRIELEVESVQSLVGIAEACLFVPPLQQSLAAAGQFVRHQDGDQVEGGHGFALLHQFPDERINLRQAQRSLRAALQAASHEAVFGDTQLQSQGTGFVRSRAAILLSQREHAHNAPRSKLTLSVGDGIAEGTDAGPSLVSPRQQLLNTEWGAPWTVLIADAMCAALLPQMLAQ